MRFNRDEYRAKVLGCWMGKNIGGTLGAPMEWRRQVNDVSFYVQHLGGEPLPNDDLDIQLLWLTALEERGVDIDAHTLAEYWLLYVTPHWAEYGLAKANLRAGLAPPLSGSVNNPYQHSCGAFIRSEIWACIAPGHPRIAAYFGYQDGILDHGDGEGTYAAVFCAALESAAFVVTDIDALLEIALSYIPDHCGVAKAVACVRECYAADKTWREAREALLTDFRGGSAWFPISEEDLAKGYDKGVVGWDAPSNIGIIVTGLLYGEGDFARTLCTAVNCGEDTDCTAATVGALFGIMHSIDAIPNEWIEPIGRKIKTACLNLGELPPFGGYLPQDVDEMTDRTERIAHELLGRRARGTAIVADEPTDTAGVTAESLKAGAYRDELYYNAKGPVYRFGAFEIAVDYGEDGPFALPGTPKPLVVTLTNRYQKYPARLLLRWYGESGAAVLPACECTLQAAHVATMNRQRANFEVVVPESARETSRFVLEVSMAGWAQVMHVPVLLMRPTQG